jgi:hypothetical protein
MALINGRGYTVTNSVNGLLGPQSTVVGTTVYVAVWMLLEVLDIVPKIEVCEIDMTVPPDKPAV